MILLSELVALCRGRLGKIFRKPCQRRCWSQERGGLLPAWRLPDEKFWGWGAYPEARA